MERSRRRPSSEYGNSYCYYPVSVWDVNDPLRPKRVWVKKLRKQSLSNEIVAALLVATIFIAIMAFIIYCDTEDNAEEARKWLFNHMYFVIVVVFMCYGIYGICANNGITPYSMIYVILVGFQDCCKHVYKECRQFYIEITPLWHRFQVTIIQGIKLFGLQCIRYVLTTTTTFGVSLIVFVKWNISMITRLLVKWTNAIIWLPHRLLKMISEELKLVKQWWISKRTIVKSAENTKAITDSAQVDEPSNQNNMVTDQGNDPVKEYLNSKVMKLESILKSQLKIFECPVCFEIMKSPRRIFGCSNDHFICSDCLKSSSIKCCPICRENYQTHKPQRRLKSEELLALISGENPESSKVEKGKSRRKLK